MSERVWLFSKDFQRYQRRDFLEYVLGDAYDLAVKDYAEQNGLRLRDAAAELSNNAAWEIMIAYRYLRDGRDGRSLEEILDASDIEYLNAWQLKQGLRWLELKGLPVRRLADRWMVNGIARQEYFSIEKGWPRALRNRWMRIRGKESPGFTAMRILFIKRAHKFSWGQMGGVPGVSGNTIRSRVYDWKNGVQPRELEIEEFGQMLGIEPVLLTKGHARAEIEPIIFKRVRRSSRAERIKELRHLAGLSRGTAAVLASIDRQALQRLEENESGVLADPAAWPRLAHALDVDVFFLLTGSERGKARSIRPMGKRIALLRLSKGWTQSRLAKELSLSIRPIRDWEVENKIPPAQYHDRLAEKLNVSKDAFGPEVDEKLPSTGRPSQIDKNLLAELMKQNASATEMARVLKISISRAYYYRKEHKSKGSKTNSVASSPLLGAGNSRPRGRKEDISSSPVKPAVAPRHPTAGQERFALNIPFADTLGDDTRFLPLWINGLVQSGVLAKGLTVLHFDPAPDRGLYDWGAPISRGG